MVNNAAQRKVKQNELRLAQSSGNNNGSSNRGQSRRGPSFPQATQSTPPKRYEPQAKLYVPTPQNNVLFDAKSKFSLLKKVGIVYDFFYNDDVSYDDALNNLSFFINKAIDSSIWLNPNSKGISPYFIFVLKNKLNGFVIPKMNNIAIVENFDNESTDNDTLFKNTLKITVSSILNVDSSFAGPFIEPNKDIYWFTELKSMNIDDLGSVFLKNNDDTRRHIKEILKWKNPIEENIQPIPGTNYAIYCHYDVNNLIQDYCITGIKCLHKLGYKTFFFSTSTTLSNEKSIEPYTEKIEFIENNDIGTEFVVLFRVLEQLKKNSIQYDNVLFMNDSLLFPLNSLKNMKETIVKTNKDNDFWGHWDEYMPKSKLQFIYSCFLHFKSSVSDEIISYLSEWLPRCNSRTEYINYIEWRMPTHLFKKNFKINSIIPFKSLKINNPKYNKIVTHNPKYIGRWLFKDETFAMKYKYIIYFLNKNSTFLTPSFWFLTRYLYIGSNIVNYYHKEKSGLYVELND